MKLWRGQVSRSTFFTWKQRRVRRSFCPQSQNTNWT